MKNMEIIKDAGTFLAGFFVSLIAYELDSKPVYANLKIIYHLISMKIIEKKNRNIFNYITIEAPFMIPWKPLVYLLISKLSNRP